MSFTAILYNLLIKPLELLFEVVYVLAYRLIDDPALAIIALSLAVNFLTLPLYKRADAVQDAERKKEDSMSAGVAHIKSCFSGDERFLMLQEYYRQNNYKPTHVVKGLMPLLLQIPFFTAAYSFLSHLALIKGVSFGPIKDLGAPDAAFVIAGFTVNILPILMTLINFVAGAIYTKGFPLKSKIQLYGMAIVFLVLLYNSPSGLVFYWTLNNVFSLGKNIVQKLFAKTKAPVAEEQAEEKEEEEEEHHRLHIPEDKYGFIFFAGCVILTLLVGVYIPGSAIKSSPVEFVNVSYYQNPLHYLKYSGVIAAGLFIVWTGIYYLFASEKIRKVFSCAAFVLALAAGFDYMLFVTKLRNMSSTLIYLDGFIISRKEIILNFFGLIALLGVAVFVFKMFKGLVKAALTVGMIVMAIMCVMTASDINKGVEKAFNSDIKVEKLSVNLSKEGKNVVVIMLDRALGMQIPYIMQEKPELAEAFDGFTFYQNTVSLGRATNFSAPSIFGGYEYTPEAMNARSDVKLADKHDEALKLMPALFYEEGYDVTVCDPPYAGYKQIPDMSIYSDYPGIHTCFGTGMFNENSVLQYERTEEIRLRNFFFYGVLKASPVCIQRIIYNDGKYNEAEAYSKAEGKITTEQYIEKNSLSKASGLSRTFMDEYSVLTALPEVTDVTDDEGCLLVLQNQTTHSPMLLQQPDYVPEEKVDNSAYEQTYMSDSDYYVVDGRRMGMGDTLKIMHYQINMAALLRLGEWFDYLREEGVYDNTRIIICSDHGYPLKQFGDLVFYDDAGLKESLDIEGVNPLLLVKDFDSTGFTASDEFMTLADIPAMAMSGVIENPINPFTGNPVNNDEKTAHEQKVIFSTNSSIDDNNGTAFKKDEYGWFSVKDNIFDENNWKYLGN